MSNSNWLIGILIETFGFRSERKMQAHKLSGNRNQFISSNVNVSKRYLFWNVLNWYSLDQIRKTKLDFSRDWFTSIHFHKSIFYNYSTNNKKKRKIPKQNQFPIYILIPVRIMHNINRAPTKIIKKRMLNICCCYRWNGNFIKIKWLMLIPFPFCAFISQFIRLDVFDSCGMFDWNSNGYCTVDKPENKQFIGLRKFKYLHGMHIAN